MDRPQTLIEKHFGWPFPFPPWLTIILLVAMSPVAAVWAILVIDATFHQSTGEYANPTFFQAARGITYGLLPAAIWIVILRGTIKRIRQSKNQTG
jgi:hypothetical protein